MAELVTPRPDYLQAFEDADWHYYVPDEGNGIEDAVAVLGEPDDFTHERLFMRPVPASSLEDYDGETTTRNAETGRYEPVICWIECHELEPDATPWFGLRYA